MTERREIRVIVNGSERTGMAEPRMLLVDFLREELGLTGTHVGCEHGVCGACTILLNGEAVRSCLMFALQAASSNLETVEGLAPGNGELHPLQDLFSRHHALQCGFCTPGMLMTAIDLLQTHPDASPEEIRIGMSGSACRCTGYQGIIDAVSAYAELLREGAVDNE